MGKLIRVLRNAFLFFSLKIRKYTFKLFEISISKIFSGIYWIWTTQDARGHRVKAQLNGVMNKSGLKFSYLERPFKLQRI